MNLTRLPIGAALSLQLDSQPVAFEQCISLELVLHDELTCWASISSKHCAAP